MGKKHEKSEDLEEVSQTTPDLEDVAEETAKEEEVTEEQEEVKEPSEEEKAQQKIAELEDLVKRQAADFDNFRKRFQDERERIKESSQEGILIDFLPIFDNIERAFESSQAQEVSIESIKIGLEGIMALFQAFLEKQGIQKIDSIGTPFDPKIHEALFTQEGDYTEKEVIQEVEKAYIRKDKVIRTAKVGVGVPKEK